MEVERGCSQALKDCRFMPTVADIRDGLKVWKQNFVPPPRLQLPEPEWDEEGKCKVLATLREMKMKLDIPEKRTEAIPSEEELRRRAEKQKADLAAHTKEM